ncbi:hypothetical protein [Demequina litorisediminis]|uniref:Glycoside hydrolase family 2 immunoglobulin-like beta-sandwich domain-containing protein n=1 Tax=Demequina litorisediminis TaxID=1849022 RepID=A0ABQ6IKH6_9MICO|nr:hypothetical protein [Demequina litorisediminis]GMA37652.1 hypothetical protein GCM10025876_38560 [Demequina litorisediminis]
MTEGVASIDAAVAEARRWDVVGRGEQALYDVELTLLDAAGEALDLVTRRVGFRSVAVVQEPDDAGTSFEIHVNGSRVWARGFNWIPADVLPERIERSHLRHLIEEAVATGANMLRVWGGGVVESDDFYDLCDEPGRDGLAGLLVRLRRLRRRRAPGSTRCAAKWPMPWVAWVTARRSCSGAAATRTCGATRTGAGRRPSAPTVPGASTCITR